MAECESDNVPQWKRELILRRRAASNKNSKQLSSVRAPDCASDALGCAGHQPSPTSAASSCGSCASAGSGSCTCIATASVTLGKCNGNRDKDTCKMVQERTWVENKNISVEMVRNGDKNDSDSSEELQYGPGIVSKLKNRYLSLTLREQNAKLRPSILPLRKATSLENLLDDDAGNEESPVENNREFESRLKNGTNGNSKKVPNRYRNPSRGSDLKRARSVETISRGDLMIDTRPKSLHEDVFIIAKEGSDKPHRKTNVDNNVFEAAENKMFSTNNVVHPRINRPKKIPLVMNEKEKPPADVVKQTKKIFEARPEMRTRPPQITGEVAAKVASYKNIIIQTKVNNKPPVKQKPVTEKPRKTPVRLPVKPAWKDPDLIKSPLQSPIPDVSMIAEPEPEKATSNLSETPDLILHSSPVHKPPSLKITTEDFITAEIAHSTETGTIRPIKASSSSLELKKVPPTQPLKLEITCQKPVVSSTPVLLASDQKKRPPPPAPPVATTAILSPREIEKNFINTAKSLEQLPQPQQEVEEKTSAVPKGKRTLRPKQEEQNSVVFTFTHRKDVPDYIGNDGTVRASKIELPKAGEGGITILPGAAINDDFADYEEELRSLEGPPSPCDVNFINDNILIDGRSSLSQKTKKPKMRIQFVEAVPQIFEYPSESSMLTDEAAVQSPSSAIAASSMGHAVPSLSGSSLANYTPKAGYSDDFQLGVTKTAAPIIPEAKAPEPQEEPEVEELITFSSGSNTDILF